MNNLQHIVKNGTRFAMHMAVELCERGDFDSVNEALRWLMKERETVECEPSTCAMEEDVGAIQTLLTCSKCGYTSKDRHPLFCGGCGRAVRWNR